MSWTATGDDWRPCAIEGCNYSVIPKRTDVEPRCPWHGGPAGFVYSRDEWGHGTYTLSDGTMVALDLKS